MVSFTLHQVTAIVDGPAYQVTNEIVGSIDSDLGAFVFVASSQVFSHYATAADMLQWPLTREIALVQNAAFYRLPQVVRTWDTVAEMNDDLACTVRRVQALADDLNAAQGALVIDRTTVIQGA